MQFDPDMQQAKQQLEAAGYDVEKPNVAEGHMYEDNLDVNAKLKRGFIDEHFRKIGESDAILVVNCTKNGVEHYIGGNTLIEIAHAYAQGLEIFLLNPIPDVSYADEVRGMAPIVLHGDLTKVQEHFTALPLLVMSTTNPIKHSAVSRALRKAGLRVQVNGIKVESGVSEQPQSIDEAYSGAANRHAQLKNAAQHADYLATIESGFHSPHKAHNVFGSTVIMLEKVGDPVKVGIDLDIEFPRHMTDKVPSQYPDVGVLVQQEYGSKLKDPFPFFTNAKLTRAKLLENAIYGVAVQL